MRWYFLQQLAGQPTGFFLYCSQNISLLQQSAVTGTFLYCSQDITVFPRP